MAKKLEKKMSVELGGVSLGKKNTAKITATFSFEAASMDANATQALLAGGQLHCRLDKGIPGQKPLLMGAEVEIPPTTVEFDATCHRIGMDTKTCNFGLSFLKSAAKANVLAEFAGQTAKLTVRRTGDIDTVDAEDEDGSAEQDDA